MHRSISIDNISFSRNYDTSIKTTNVKSVTDSPIWVNLISSNSNTDEIEHNMLNSLVIPHYGFHFRPTDLTDKPHSQDYGSICK